MLLLSEIWFRFQWSISKWVPIDVKSQHRGLCIPQEMSEKRKQRYGGMKVAVIEGLTNPEDFSKYNVSNLLSNESNPTLPPCCHPITTKSISTVLKTGTVWRSLDRVVGWTKMLKASDCARLPSTTLSWIHNGATWVSEASSSHHLQWDMVNIEKIYVASSKDATLSLSMCCFTNLTNKCRKKEWLNQVYLDFQLPAQLKTFFLFPQGDVMRTLYGALKSFSVCNTH